MIVNVLRYSELTETKMISKSMALTGTNNIMLENVIFHPFVSLLVILSIIVGCFEWSLFYSLPISPN
jgi:hypothetical protein